MKVSARSTSSKKMMYGAVVAAISILSSSYSLASDYWQDSTRSMLQSRSSEQSAYASDRGHSQEKKVDHNTVEIKKPTLNARDLLYMRNVVALEVAALCFFGDLCFPESIGTHSALKAVFMLGMTMYIVEFLFYKYFSEKVNIYYPEDWNRCL